MAGRVVSTQVLTKVFTVAKGVLVTAPTHTVWNLGDVTLDRLEFDFPAGCAYLLNVNVAYSGTVIVPWGNPATWIASNAIVVEAVVGLDVDGGLTIQGFNTDKVNAHSVYLRAHCTANSTLAAADTPTTQQVITSGASGTPGSASDDALIATPTVDVAGIDAGLATSAAGGDLL